MTTELTIEILEAVRLWEVESTYSRKHFTIEERADAIDAAIIAVREAAMLQRRIEQLEAFLSQNDIGYVLRPKTEKTAKQIRAAERVKVLEEAAQEEEANNGIHDPRGVAAWLRALAAPPDPDPAPEKIYGIPVPPADQIPEFVVIPPEPPA